MECHCNEGPCAGADQGVGCSTECCAGTPSPPRALLLWPVLPPLSLPTFPLLSQECPGTAHALVWEPGLSIYLELALHSLTQGGAARVIPRWRALDVPPSLV